jgi:hypothetical protein
MNQIYDEELENLENKNLKYWSTHYSKEGNLINDLNKLKSNIYLFIFLLNNSIIYCLYLAEKIQLKLNEFGFDKSDLYKIKKSFENLVDIAQQLKISDIEESR